LFTFYYIGKEILGNEERLIHMKLLVINGSTREKGNSEFLTNVLLHDIPHSTLFLRDYQINPIKDQRHAANGFDPVDDDYERLIKQVLEHDILLFATPLYWYGMSGLMKNFVDRWSQCLRDKTMDFRSEMAKKQAFVVIVGGDRIHIKALPLVQQFQYIFDFMDMSMIGYLIGQGTKPEEVQNDRRALENAATWNKKIRELL
jgi:multimeric flavodoxin WrbA